MASSVVSYATSTLIPHIQTAILPPPQLQHRQLIPYYFKTSAATTIITNSVQQTPTLSSALEPRAEFLGATVSQADERLLRGFILFFAIPFVGAFLFSAVVVCLLDHRRRRRHRRGNSNLRNNNDVETVRDPATDLHRRQPPSGGAFDEFQRQTRRDWIDGLDAAHVYGMSDRRERRSPTAFDRARRERASSFEELRLPSPALAPVHVAAHTSVERVTRTPPPKYSGIA